MHFMKHIKSFRFLSRGSNSSFITLVPNVNDPLTLSEFRPIILIRCVFKIIAKTLMSWIKKVIGLIIYEVQTNFIHGCNILEGRVIINEVCSWANKAKSKKYLFKVDFEKTFDSIN